MVCFFFFQAEDGIRDYDVTGVQTCALPISIPGGSSIASCGTSLIIRRFRYKATESGPTWIHCAPQFRRGLSFVHVGCAILGVEAGDFLCRRRGAGCGFKEAIHQGNDPFVCIFHDVMTGVVEAVHIRVGKRLFESEIRRASCRERV